MLNINKSNIYYNGDSMKENKNRLSEIIEVLKNSNILHDHSPENVRLTIEKLGSTYIKIGQILSTRVDF